jgi:hypothetical protein
VFDLTSGYSWTGRRDPQLMMPSELEAAAEKFVPLDDIRALQLIRKQVLSTRSCHESTATNLQLRAERDRE